MMESIDKKSKIFGSLVWKVAENGGSQGIQFIVSIILARLLSPDEYGLVAIVLVFTTIANVLIQNGFATALIQKKEADLIDFSSVLYFQLFCAIFVYGILYIVAPYIATLYEEPALMQILRVTSVIVFFGAAISVLNSYVARGMHFKVLFWATLFASVISGGISIAMAYAGYKVWALVWQQVIYYIILLVVLLIGLRFIPVLTFSITRLKAMFAFGSKLLGASIIDTTYNNIHGLIIGKVYSQAVLGNYSRGEQFPKLLVSNLGAAIQSVMLPVMSGEEKGQVKALLKETLKISTYIILPMMAGLMAVSESLIYVLLGEAWTKAVPFLVFMCIAYAFWPIHIANLQAINARGKSDIFLKLEIIKKTLGIIVLLIGIEFGAVILVALKAVADLISAFINAYPNQKLVGYRIWEQVCDVAPQFILSGMMGILVYGIRLWCGIGLGTLLLQIVVGAVVYILLSIFSKNVSFLKVKQILENMGKGDLA